MKKVYACLLGEWVCLNDDPDCLVGDERKRPNIWWEENAPVYAPTARDAMLNDSFYGLDYVNIFYKKKSYRINPMFIQIVSE